MSAVHRLPQRDMAAHRARARQAGGRHERIVQRVEHQRRDADARQVRLGRCAGPVVLGVLEAMQWRGEQVVEVVQVARGQHLLAAEQAGVLGQLGQCLGPHGVEEHAGVDLPVEAAADGVAAGRQIDRRADGRHRTGGGRCAVTGLFGPAQQRVAAQRDADRVDRRTGLQAQALQDPADLLEVARVVGARAAVELARAAAEMRHRHLPAGALRPAGEGLGVVALRRTFQSVEQHQQRRAGRGAFVEVVDVDEVVVGRDPALAAPARHGAGLGCVTRQLGRPDRLRVAAGQPPGRLELLHQRAPGRRAVSAAPRAPRRPRSTRAPCRGWHGGPPCASPGRS